MSLYEDWVKIGVEMQGISNLLGVDCTIEWGDFAGGQSGVIILEGQASVQTKTYVTARAKRIRTVLYNYPQTVFPTIRIKWPAEWDPSYQPATTPSNPPPPPQDPPPPPWMYPVTPKSTPPTSNDKTFIARKQK